MMLKIMNPATCSRPTTNWPSRSPRSGTSGARIAASIGAISASVPSEAQQHENRPRRIGERELHDRPVAGPADDDDREVEIDDARARRAPAT